uniref:Ycf36 n=1 Tax=Porolithon onkodes TaxID=231751 RepID=A0A2Z2KXM9_9FLOR|nr:hypothetical protein [Porolithon onkodes]ASB29735.1 hypothetical protein [Porolithon onkodes]
MSFSNNICPVPFDQQPLNEFYALKKSCFFSFFGFKLSKYIYRLFILGIILVLLCTPFVIKSINFSWKLFILDEFFCTILLLSLVLMRLYLGWSYIISRLFSATIFYEESGWHDGQIWIKTPEMLTKDRLIGTYYVLPLLYRIKWTFVILGLCFVMNFVFYSLLY